VNLVAAPFVQRRANGEHRFAQQRRVDVRFRRRQASAVVGSAAQPSCGAIADMARLRCAAEQTG